MPHNFDSSKIMTHNCDSSKMMTHNFDSPKMMTHKPNRSKKGILCGPGSIKISNCGGCGCIETCNVYSLWEYQKSNLVALGLISSLVLENMICIKNVHFKLLSVYVLVAHAKAADAVSWLSALRG